MSVDIARSHFVTPVALQREDGSLIAKFGDRERHASLDHEEDYVALIDKRMLERECLAHSLEFHKIDRKVMTFCDLGEWRAASRTLGTPSAVLFNADNTAIAQQQL